MANSTEALERHPALLGQQLWHIIVNPIKAPHSKGCMHPLEPLLKKAILGRKRVIATYGGLRREMCPHIIGAKGNKPHCLFYQYGGESAHGLEPPGSPNNWRCLPLEGLDDVEVREGEWFSADNYTTVQSCIDTIDTMTVMDIGESG